MKKTLFVCVMGALLFSISGKAYGQYNYTNYYVIQYDYTLPGDDTTDLFFKAASVEDLVTLKNMLDQYPTLVHAMSKKDYKTALHIACMTGKYDSVKLLLDRGANPNALDIFCKSPYYYARVSYRHNICRLLRQRGAYAEYVRFFPHCCTQDHPYPHLQSEDPVCIPDQTQDDSTFRGEKIYRKKQKRVRIKK